MDHEQADRLISVLAANVDSVSGVRDELRAIADEQGTTSHWLREMVGLLEPIKIYLEGIDNKLNRLG